jgi:putative PIN family toxin of toxin-antitoxin system
MTRAVVDANVFLSAWARIGSASSQPAEVVRRWISGSYDLISSEHIVREVRQGFEKPYFRRTLPAGAMEQAMAVLHARSEVVTLTGAVTGVARHQHDDPVLETAVVGNADCIVTGDRQLLALGRYQGVVILTPGEFLGVLDRESAADAEDST